MNPLIVLWLWLLPLSTAQLKKCHWEDHPDSAGAYAVNSYLDTRQHVTSEDGCKALCGQTSACVAVDWSHHYHTCVLYHTPPYITYHKGSLHSVHNCVKKPCTWYKRWCIKGAHCVNRTCVCPPHAPKGDGAFDCVPHYKELCTVNCDPKAKTWDGAVVPVNLPCWYRLTDFYVHNPSLRYRYNKCHVQVHVLNQLTARGLFFVRRVLVKAWLGRQRQSGLYSWPLYSSYLVDLDHHHVWKALRSQDTLFDRKPELHLGDLTIQRSFDRHQYFAVVRFDECWVHVKYRPYDPDHQPQRYKPGVTVAIPKHAHFPVDKKMSTVCLSPGQGPSAYEEHAWHHGLASGEELVLHNILLMGLHTQKPDIYHEHRDGCVAAVTAFTSPQCEEFRAFTVHLCAPILNHRRLIHCFQSYEVSPMEVFTQCVRWGCEGDVDQCHHYTHHLAPCHPTPSFINKVHCDPGARLKLGHYYYNITLAYQHESGGK